MIITHWEQSVCTALAADRKILQLGLEPMGKGPKLNDIYVGKVQSIQKNISAAFVDIGGVTGYYSLKEGMDHLYTEQRKKHAKGPAQALKVGDEIVVQVCREAVKTKAPVLTEKLSFAGKRIVLTLGKSGIGFSNKITDQKWRQEMKLALSPLLEVPWGPPEGAGSSTSAKKGGGLSEGHDGEPLQSETGRGALEGTDGTTGQQKAGYPGPPPGRERTVGIIIRTNGKDATIEELQAEIRQLMSVCRRVLDNGGFRSCYSLLYQAPAAFLAQIRNAYADRLGEIVTDDPALYAQIDRFLREEQPEDAQKLRLYQDDLLPLKELYGLDKAMADALAKRVWLKSGGYLVIEPTEALVAIDVNTGKYSGKRTKRETIVKINLEAAEEIGRQLRLRELSGIVLVDFIDMEEEEDRACLLDHLRTVVQKDPVKTTVVDMTELGLVELTRKKLRRPLHEQLAAVRAFADTGFSNTDRGTGT